MDGIIYYKDSKGRFYFYTKEMRWFKQSAKCYSAMRTGFVKTNPVSD